MKNDRRGTRRLVPLLFTLSLFLTASFDIAAAPDPANYRLTESTLARLKAVEAEFKQAAGKNKRPQEAAADPDEEHDAAEEADAAEDDTPAPSAQGRGPGGKRDDSVEGIAAKVEANPQIKAALAKQGLTPTDYALATHAMLHAGMFVMFEKAMDPQKAKGLLSGYTPAQRDNIDIVRRSAAAAR